MVILFTTVQYFQREKNKVENSCLQENSMVDPCQMWRQEQVGKEVDFLIY